MNISSIFIGSVLIISAFHLIVATGRNQTTKLIRHKRYLDFLPKSRMFFRSNVKANVLSANQILAFAYGYRANYPIENDRKIRRRDVYDSVEELMTQHGYDGRACVLSMVCATSKEVTPGTGMFFNLFKRIFSIPEGQQSEYPYLTSENCAELMEHCPHEMFNLSPYTDL